MDSWIPSVHILERHRLHSAWILHALLGMPMRAVRMAGSERPVRFWSVLSPRARLHLAVHRVSPSSSALSSPAPELESAAVAASQSPLSTR